MKIYNSKYRYSKLDHTEIKRMIYEISEGLKNHEILSIAHHFNKVIYYMDIERSNYIKNLIYMDFSCSIQKSPTDICDRFVIRVKKFKIKLNWYCRDDLRRLWEYTYF